MIHLNVSGLQWPPLVGARGGGKQAYRDPFFGEPLYQQAFGLHQALDDEAAHMIKDRDRLGVVTKDILQYESTNNTAYEESMINIIITFCETSEHTDEEILALMKNDLGLKYSDEPMWKPSEDIPLERMKILAATQRMDDILWGYMRNIVLNVDGVRCAIFMMPADATSEINLYYRGQLTRAGRRQFTVTDFPLGVEARMQEHNIHLCVRTTMRTAWYKSLLQTGEFDVYFRSEADHARYSGLTLKDRPFLLTELAETNQGFAPINSTRDHLSDGNDLGIHKLDILYLSRNLHLSKVERMLKQLGVPHQGLRKIMQRNTCKFTVGYNEQAHAISACRGMHGKAVPNIKPRNTLVIAVNYQVPRNHCFRCFTLVDPEVSRGHTAKECPHRNPPPCAVCHEIHESERCGWYEHQDRVLHDYDVITNADRARQAQARSAAMTATAYASVAGSHYGSQYAGSLADPTDLEPYHTQGRNSSSPPFRHDSKGTPHNRGQRRNTDQDSERHNHGDLERVQQNLFDGFQSSQASGNSSHRGYGFTNSSQGNQNHGGRYSQEERTPGRQQAQDQRTTQHRYDGRQSQQQSPASPVRTPESVLGSPQFTGRLSDQYEGSSYAGSQAHPSQLAPGYIRPPRANDISYKPRNRRYITLSNSTLITNSIDVKGPDARSILTQYGEASPHSRPLLQYTWSTLKQYKLYIKNKHSQNIYPLYGTTAGTVAAGHPQQIQPKQTKEDKGLHVLTQYLTGLWIIWVFLAYAGSLPQTTANITRNKWVMAIIILVSNIHIVDAATYRT